MKIPVTIITGFLGSGKTTLITNLLKTTPDKRLAVLVNEFGEVSIDGDLLRAAGQESGGGVEIHDLPNGCICCTVQDDFMPTMLRLKERKHEIDHILIETSGLALPTPVMAALNWPEIRNDFELDAVLTVVDTPELLAGHLEVGQPIPGAEQAEEVPEHINGVAVILNEQLENADVVILNKIDEIREDDLMKAEEQARKKAPRIRFLELAYEAKLDTRLCLGLNVSHEDVAVVPHTHGPGGHHHGPVSSTPDSMDGPLEDQTQFDGHSHGDMGEHEHGDGTHEHFHEHDTGWQSFVLHSHQAQDSGQVKEAIEAITRAQPILRAKGHVAIDGKNHKMVYQAVRSRVQNYFEKNHTHDTDSRVVFIGYHPRRQEAINMMNEITGMKWG